MTCTEPSPWQATNNSPLRNAMSIGCEPTLIAACSRNDGSIRLTVSLLRLVTARSVFVRRDALFRRQVEVQSEGGRLADMTGVCECVALSKNGRRHRSHAMIAQL